MKFLKWGLFTLLIIGCGNNKELPGQNLRPVVPLNGDPVFLPDEGSDQDENEFYRPEDIDAAFTPPQNFWEKAYEAEGFVLNVSTAQNPPEEAAESNEANFSQLGEEAIDYAAHYLSSFYLPEFRRASSHNRKMFALGVERFKKTHRRVSEQGIPYRGYVLGGEGEHILSGTDCSRFIFTVWNEVFTQHFGEEKEYVPYFSTMYLYNIAKSYEEALSFLNQTEIDDAVKEEAERLYGERIENQRLTFNKKYNFRLGKGWKTKVMGHFKHYVFVPDISRALPGDAVMFLTDFTPYLERGHVYLYIHGERRGGIGAQRASVGLAYNNHRSDRKNYVLRPNFRYYQNH